jgi:predicted dehydrogenase
VIGVLLAGFSGIGDQDHQTAMYLPAWRAQPGARVVAVAPSRPGDVATAQKVAAELGVPVYDTIADALGAEGVDVVSVAVPLDQRVDVIVAALRAGKAVLADKPLAPTLDGVETIAAAADRAIVVPALHVRLAGSLVAARAAVAAGRVGLPWNVQADFVVAGGSAAPSGELLNLGGYPVDVLHAVLGLDAVQVYARAGRHWHDGVDDVVTLLIDYANGVTGTVLVGRTGPLDGVRAGGLARHRYRISGSHGVLDLDATRPALRVRTTDGARAPEPDTVAALVAATCRAVANGARPPVSIDDARHVHQIIDAAERSLASGRPERVIQK